MKDLKKLQVKTFKENLIKFKNYLIKKNKINDRIKKDFNSYYERNKFKGARDTRYFSEEDDFAHEDIRHLFNESPFK